MSKFLLITKINLLSIFNLNKIFSFKSKNDKKKKIIKFLLITGILIYILLSIYILTDSMMPFFIEMNKPIYLLSLLFSVCCIYIFFANILKIKTLLFDFKDYDLLMSLPINRNLVLASKIVSLYITNLLYTLIIMIPGYIAYINHIDLLNDWLFFILLPTIPIIPIFASSIIGILLTWLTSLFRNKNIGSYVVNIMLIIVLLFLYFSTYSIDTKQIANNGINLVNSFSNYYPLTNIFVSLLNKIDIVNLIIYFTLPIILTFIFILLINYSYLKLRAKLLRQKIKSDYKIRKYVLSSQLFSLYKKEIKRYFSSSLYVINTSFGCILLFVLIISIILFNENAINYFTKINGFNEIIKNNIFLVFSILCVLSSTTNSAISLEGKSFWILKMLPVSLDKIFISKIMVNLTILIPTIIIGGTFFGIILHLSFIEFLFIYLTPLAYGIFASVNGLLLNITFPRFDYESEVRVIKQSMAVFLTILVGVIMVFVPFNLLDININSIMLITSVMFMIDIFIIIILHYYGTMKINKI